MIKPQRSNSNAYLFVYFADEVLADTFLTALVEKGLKLERVDQAFLILMREQKDSQAVKKLYAESIKEIAPRAVVIFGEDLSDSLLTKESAALRAPSISEISNDALLKKTFWKELQAL